MEDFRFWEIIPPGVQGVGHPQPNSLFYGEAAILQVGGIGRKASPIVIADRRPPIAERRVEEVGGSGGSP